MSYPARAERLGKYELSESERNSETGIRTHFLRCRSPAIKPQHDKDFLPTWDVLSKNLKSFDLNRSRVPADEPKILFLLYCWKTKWQDDNEFKRIGKIQTRVPRKKNTHTLLMRFSIHPDWSQILETEVVFFNERFYCSISKVKLATLVEGYPKAPFSIATTPKCRGGRNSISWISSLYPWSLPYNAEC